MTAPIPIGALIVGVFAIVWTAAGSRVLGRRWMFVLTVLAVFISAAIAHLAAHHPPAYPMQFHPRPYIIAVAFELIAIFIAVVVLRRRRQYDLILPIISIIVGLHFFGMVPALDSNEYWWVGAAMSLWPLGVMALAPRRWWIPMTGLGCAIILWISIVWSISF